MRRRSRGKDNHYRRMAVRKRKRMRRERQEQRERDRKMTAKHGERAHVMCGRKKRYKSSAQATARALNSLYKGDAPMLRVYKCPYCGGWHLTSQPPVDSEDCGNA